MKQLSMDQVQFKINVLAEFEPIEKALGVEFTGADHSEYIKKVQNDNGCNPWLWCTVCVVASFGGLIGTAYLGQCAYENEQQFIEGGYYEQMKADAFNELKCQVDNLITALA